MQPSLSFTLVDLCDISLELFSISFVSKETSLQENFETWTKKKRLSAQLQRTTFVCYSLPHK